MDSLEKLKRESFYLKVHFTGSWYDKVSQMNYKHTRQVLSIIDKEILGTYFKTDVLLLADLRPFKIRAQQLD